MQLRLSLFAVLYLASALQAEDYVRVQYMEYDEDSGRTTIETPSFEINKDFGVDYTLNLSVTHDSMSGASSRVKSEDLEVVSSEVGFTQVIDTTSRVKASLFFIAEDGYLSNPCMRVVRDYKMSPRIVQEQKPSTRNAHGVMFEYAKAFGNLGTTSSYRLYDDDWGDYLTYPE